MWSVYTQYDSFFILFFFRVFFYFTCRLFYFICRYINGEDVRVVWSIYLSTPSWTPIQRWPDGRGEDTPKRSQNHHHHHQSSSSPSCPDERGEYRTHQREATITIIIIVARQAWKLRICRKSIAQHWISSSKNLCKFVTAHMAIMSHSCNVWVEGMTFPFAAKISLSGSTSYSLAAIIILITIHIL